MLKGSYVALVTPMNEAGEIDYPAYEQLIEWHLQEQTDGFVVLGTTAESPTISADERLKIIQVSLAVVNKSKPVIVGTGTNCTRHTIELTRQAHELGADAALLIAPYYNKPTQEGLFLHHKAVAKAVPIPQILYNNPSRTGCDLLPETAKRIGELSNVIALKETVEDIDRFDYIVNETSLQLFSGSDSMNCDLLLRGGSGVISVVANVVPKQLHKLCQYALTGQTDQACALDQRLKPLYEALFVEANPIPTKWALQQMGKIKKGIRLPLTWLTEQNEALVKQALMNEEITCVI
jgi:4-hydroxy-tetrahydrodipicolinate synthase